MAATDPVTPEPRRFSLRLPRPLWIGVAASMVIVVAVGVQIGMPIYRQEVAIREIDRAGGFVDTERSGLDWLRLRKGRGPMTLFDDVLGVRLSATKATDAALDHVACLTTLQVLWLDNTSVDDAGLARLNGMSSLRLLSPPGPSIR